MAKHWRETMFFGINVTDEQAAVLDAAFDPSVQVIFIDAVAGAGKTTLATGAAKLLGMPLYYFFSPVEERRQGYRPGTQEEKNRAYIQPLRKALKKIGENPDQAIFSETNFKAGAWVFPDADTFLRGDDIENVVAIIDEAENWTLPQLKKVLTRFHDNCKVFVIGHVDQCDLPDPCDSGFSDYIDHFRNESYARVLPLTRNFRGRLSQHADKLKISR